MKVIFDGKFEIGDLITKDIFYGGYYKVVSCKKVDPHFEHELKCEPGSKFKSLYDTVIGDTFFLIVGKQKAGKVRKFNLVEKL